MNCSSSSKKERKKKRSNPFPVKEEVKLVKVSKKTKEDVEVIDLSSDNLPNVKVDVASRNSTPDKVISNADVDVNASDTREITPSPMVGDGGNNSDKENMDPKRKKTRRALNRRVTTNNLEDEFAAATNGQEANVNVSVGPGPGYVMATIHESHPTLGSVERQEAVPIDDPNLEQVNLNGDITFVSLSPEQRQRRLRLPEKSAMAQHKTTKNEPICYDDARSKRLADKRRQRRLPRNQKIVKYLCEQHLSTDCDTGEKINVYEEPISKPWAKKKIASYNLCKSSDWERSGKPVLTWRVKQRVGFIEEEEEEEVSKEKVLHLAIVKFDKIQTENGMDNEMLKNIRLWNNQTKMQKLKEWDHVSTVSDINLLAEDEENMDLIDAMVE